MKPSRLRAAREAMEMRLAIERGYLVDASGVRHVDDPVLAALRTAKPASAASVPAESRTIVKKKNRTTIVDETEVEIDTDDDLDDLDDDDSDDDSDDLGDDDDDSSVNVFDTAKQQHAAAVEAELQRARRLMGHTSKDSFTVVDTTRVVPLVSALRKPTSRKGKVKGQKGKR